MKFQVSDGAKYEKVLEVEVPVDELEMPIKYACRRLADKVAIPGFRKGKAPRSVLESFVGMDGILQEMADDLVPKAFEKGLAETGLEPVAHPSTEIVTLAANEPLRFKVTVTVKPEVKLGQYKELPVTRQILKVTDEDIDRELESQRQRMTKLTDVTDDRPAEMGDTANIDFRGIKDGEAFDGGTAQNYPLALGSHSFIPGFEEQVVGMKLGEEKNIEVTFPDEYQEPSLAGQAVTFEVKLNKLQKPVLPELDQAFVEEVSETAGNLEQLRAEIRENLQMQSQSMADDNTKASALGAAIDNAEIDLPPVMVEHDLWHMIDDMRQRLESQGLTMEQYLQYTGGTMEMLQENYRGRAELMARRELVLEAIIKAEAIEVNNDELNAKLADLSAQYGQPVADIKAMLEKQNMLEDLAYSVKMEKASNIIYDTAVITEVEMDREKLMAEAHAAEEALKKVAAEEEAKEEAEKTEAE